MSDKIIDKSCMKFVQVLSSKAPVPGGGGASALVGAIGIALGNMVGNLTVGKKRYADVEEDIIELMRHSDELQARFLELVEKDAKAFEPLSKAYGMPKETKEQQAEKEKVMEQALIEASKVPYEIMEACKEAVDLIDAYAEKGSKIAISDAGVAASCIRAALNGAALNIFINTKLMKDTEYAKDMNERTELLLEEYTKKADYIYKKVIDKIRQ